MCCKVNLQGTELGEQLWAGAWELNPDTLDTVSQLWGDCLNNGNGSVLVQVNLVEGASDKLSATSST